MAVLKWRETRRFVINLRVGIYPKIERNIIFCIMATSSVLLSDLEAGSCSSYTVEVRLLRFWKARM
ncbi:hypothetical protein YC2023_117798 [Brassica napus]